MYSKETLARFKKPKFAGEMKDADGVGQLGNVRCGDVLKIFIKVKDNKIKDIKFLTYGCVAAIAASDMMCELAKGKTLEAALKIKYDDIIKRLGDLPQIKYHCSVLSTAALKKAIDDYRSKQKKTK